LIFDAFGRLIGDNNNSENNFGGGENAIRYESPRAGRQVIKKKKMQRKCKEKEKEKKKKENRK
jgi:hypothetical protein